MNKIYKKVIGNSRDLWSERKLTTATPVLQMKRVAQAE